MLISALLILLLYTLNLLPPSDISHFSTLTRAISSKSVIFLYTELNGMRYFSDNSVAVFPSFIIENNIVLDWASAKASKTFWFISYFFNCANDIFFFNIFWIRSA